MRAENRSESQWVDLCLSCALQSFLQKWFLKIKTSWCSSFHQNFMNGKVRARQEGGMKEQWPRIPSIRLQFQPLMSCFQTFTVVMLSGDRRTQARSSELGLSNQESQSQNPQGYATKGICWRRLCVCVCVTFDIWLGLTFTLTSSSHRSACVGWAFNNKVGECVVKQVRVRR